MRSKWSWHHNPLTIYFKIMLSSLCRKYDCEDRYFEKEQCVGGYSYSNVKSSKGKQEATVKTDLPAALSHGSCKLEYLEATHPLKRRSSLNPTFECLINHIHNDSYICHSNWSSSMLLWRGALLQSASAYPAQDRPTLGPRDKAIIVHQGKWGLGFSAACLLTYIGTVVQSRQPAGRSYAQTGL